MASPSSARPVPRDGSNGRRIPRELCELVRNWANGMDKNAGYAYKDMEEHGMLLPVVDLTCKFIMPARYDDMVLVCTRIAEMTPLRMSFESEIRRVDREQFHSCEAEYGEALPGELLVQGGTKHVWVNRSFQPTRLSKAFPELYEALAGK